MTQKGAKLKTSPDCQHCSMRNLCVPAGMSSEELSKLAGLVSSRRRVLQNNALFRAGDQFQSIYAIRSGFFKTLIHDKDARTQVTGFQIPGDVLGLDGLSGTLHHADTIALEDSEVCVIRYSSIDQISKICPSLQLQLNRVMSGEIVKDHGVMMLLGSMRARERLAVFILNLSMRFDRLGYSATEFNLRMSREDIGSYLGLKIETVSRTFTKLQSDELIDVHGRNIAIVDLPGLKRIVDRSD